LAYIVKQPASHGRIIIYLAESQHIPGKGARQIRTYLGSLDVENNELILNAKAKEPNPEVLELLKAKGIAYGSQKSDGPGRKHTRKASLSIQKQLMSDLEKSDVFEVGRVLTLPSSRKDSRRRTAGGELRFGMSSIYMGK